MLLEFMCAKYAYDLAGKFIVGRVCLQSYLNAIRIVHYIRKNISSQKSAEKLEYSEPWAEKQYWYMKRGHPMICLMIPSWNL